VVRRPDAAKALDWEPSDFRPGGFFVLGSLLIMGILAALYAVFW